MSQNENITPEEFTKQISPMKDGIRASIEKTGNINYVYKWMREFSDQQKKPLQDNIDLLKNEVETWVNSYSSVYDKYRKYKTESKQLQSRIKEIEEASIKLFDLAHNSENIEDKIKANELYEIIKPNT